MMHVLSPDLKQKNKERAEKRDRAEKREREKVARRVHGDRGTSLQRRPDRNRQMSAVNNIAAERGKRHKKKIDRLQLVKATRSFELPISGAIHDNKDNRLYWA